MRIRFKDFVLFKKKRFNRKNKNLLGFGSKRNNFFRNNKTNNNNVGDLKNKLTSRHFFKKVVNKNLLSRRLRRRRIKFFLLRRSFLTKIYKLKVQKKRKTEFDFLYFIGRKISYNSKTKLITIFNNIFGGSSKRFLLFLACIKGYSLNSFVMVLNINLFHFWQNKFRGLLLNLSLRRYVKDNIYLKQKYGLYSGFRHELCLPVRGQRSKTNAGTMKRKRRINVTAGKSKKSKKKNLKKK